MAKQGMARPDWTKLHPRNEQSPVPHPIIAQTMGAEQKVWHEKPIPDAYRAIDTDLARDNLENDLTMADLQDL